MNEHDTVLRDRLRAGDPLGAPGAGEADVLARLARRLAALDPPPAAPLAGRSLLVPLAAAAVVGLAAVALLTPRSRLASEPAATRGAPAARPAASGGTSAEDDEIRQLQFETPGGTRVVWVLDPNLAL